MKTDQIQTNNTIVLFAIKKPHAVAGGLFRILNGGVVYSLSSQATSIRPQCSQVIMRLRWRISLWRCGGILL